MIELGIDRFAMAIDAGPPTMPRPNDGERHELSDAEKRDLIKLIEQGKPHRACAEGRRGRWAVVSKSRLMLPEVAIGQLLFRKSQPLTKNPRKGFRGFQIGCRGWIRTSDLQVMSQKLCSNPE